MFSRKPPGKLSNSEKMHEHFKADRRRKNLQGIAVLVPIAVLFILLSYTGGTAAEVTATATSANVSYRTKASHRQQVALENGQLIMIELPHAIMLSPGEKVLLARHYLIAPGLKRYRFIARLGTADRQTKPAQGKQN